MLWQHFLGDYDFAFARRDEGTVFAVFRLVGSVLVEPLSCRLGALCARRPCGGALRRCAAAVAAGSVSDGAVESFGVGAVI